MQVYFFVRIRLERHPLNIKALTQRTQDHPAPSTKRIVFAIGSLNFLHYAALGLAAPFVNLYLKDVGFSATQIGILISVVAALELVVTPLSNALADRMKRHRFLYYVQTAAMVVSMIAMAVTPLRWLLSGAYVVQSMHIRASNESLSQLMLTRLDELKLNIFGRLRLWGSVGWAVATIASSAIIAIGSYPLVFIASAVMRAAMFPFMNALPEKTAGERTTKPKRRRRGLYVLMLSQFLFFVGFNALIAFLAIFIQDDLGVPLAQIGFYFAFFAICEIIPMMLVDRWLGRWGTRKALIAGMGGMALCWLIYGLLPAPAWLLVVQMFRGAAFTLFTLGTTVMISEISDPANVATNRALVQVTMPALAMLLTSPLMGWLYDTYGAQMTFSVGAAMGFISVVLLVVNYRHLVSEKDV